MIIWNILQNVSFGMGHDLLLEEGYTEEEFITKSDKSCDKLILYPYSLKTEQGVEIDRIYFAEYCNQVVDDEYADRRMTLEPIETKWIRE